MNNISSMQDDRILSVTEIGDDMDITMPLEFETIQTKFKKSSLQRS
jgi:hypothetical protein